MGNQNKQPDYISVPEALKIAVAAGLNVTLPTVRSFVKKSKSVTRFGHQFFMRRDEFLEIITIRNDKNEGQATEQGGTGGEYGSAKKDKGSDA